MATPKVLLYYGFADLADPDAIRLWQQSLCEQFGLRGRIIVAPHGINGTVGGDVRDVKKYLKATKQYPAFKNIDFKWSEGTLGADGAPADFPRLSVKVRPELVAFGAPDEVKLVDGELLDGGTHLSPQALHDLVAEKDVVFFDGRNKIESDIGHFKNAVLPPVETTREFIELIDSGAYDHLKDKPVVTYCTGGIRCEILTPIMKRRGFQELYQIDGGIATYGDQFGDDGLWEGSLYVFDGRVTQDFSDHADVVGHCDTCDSSTSSVVDCDDVSCVRQFVRCATCAAASAACDRHAAKV